MEYLIACDLEGIHGIVGEPNKGLVSDVPDYKVATANAEKEINVVAKALFDSGATKVALWDNHWAMYNVDLNKIDNRVLYIHMDSVRGKPRYSFVKEHNFAGIIFLGYHSRAGTLNGVLAHTFSSAIQYAKINGVSVGELEMDSYICATYGIAPIFMASDDICVAQFKQSAPDITSVITKIAKGRNAAEFIDEDVVLDNLYNGICEAVKKENKVISIDMPIDLEVRYTRSEYAAEKVKRAERMNIPVCYGEDAHILFYKINKIDDVPLFM